MLRRPSESPSIRREEGCSSTAIGEGMTVVITVWNNLVDRGSVMTTVIPSPAVP
jgi:hypothetical protein